MTFRIPKVGLKARARIAAVLIIGLAATVSIGHADSINGTLYFTTFQPVLDGAADAVRNVWRVDFGYDGAATFTLSNKTSIALTDGADGIAFDPTTGDLLVGGQNSGLLHRVDPTTGATVSTAANAGAGGAYHLSVDPNADRVFVAGIPGDLGEVNLNTFAPGTFHNVTLDPTSPFFGALAPLVGNDWFVDTLAWVPGGETWFTTSNASGDPGYVGTIDLTTYVAKPLLQLEAHGMAFDPFTGDLMVMGHDQITQIDPSTQSVVGSRSFSLCGPPQGQFDQGTVDGKGHLFAATNCGDLLFMDYSATGNVQNAANPVFQPFLSANLDDIAPLSGAGAQVVPEPATLTLLGLGAAAGLARRRLRRRANS